MMATDVQISNPSPLSPLDVFINYTHPDQRAAQRRKVARYIGTYHRNRSKPARQTSSKQHKAAPQIRPRLSNHVQNNVPADSNEAKQDYQPPVTTILNNGNSDPFQAYAIDIGPDENQMLNFYRDVFLAAQYRERLPEFMATRLQIRDWEGCVAGLHDEGIAHALFARLGCMIAKFAPNGASASTWQHQQHSLRLLRSKAARGKLSQAFGDYMHISHLYSAETLSRNLQGTIVHGKMLLRMFKEVWSTGTIDTNVLMWQVHNDIQTAVIFLVPPLFDVDEWLPRVFAPVRPQEKHFNQPWDPAEDDIDTSVQGQLRLYFNDVRNFWTGMKAHDKMLATGTISPALLLYHTSRGMILIGRLVNFYLETVQKLHDTSVAPRLKAHYLVQRYLSLAAIYLVKALNLNPVVRGIPLFDARPSVLSALRQALEGAQHTSGKMARNQYKRATLWTLYVGAMAEQTSTDNHPSVRERWFMKEFVRYIAFMKLITWEETRSVLERFLYNEQINSNDRSLFDSVTSITSDAYVE